MNWDTDRKASVLQLRTSEVPPRFQDATLDGIQTKSVRTLVEEYLTGFWTFAPAGKAPALLGRAGVYKSYGASVIAQRVRELALVDVAFVQCGPEFLELEGRRFEDRVYRRLAWLAEVPLLVLDDFMKPRPLSWGADMIDSLVEKRYGAQLPTVYTGNVLVKAGDFSEITAHFGAGFARRFQEGATGLTVCVK